MADLLLELFSEEIPARMQKRASEDLQKMVTDALAKEEVFGEGARAFATPRRLTLAISGLPVRQQDRKEERKGPRVGAPEKAMEGFLKSSGLTLDQCETREDKKGEYYVAVIEKTGRGTDELIAEIVPDVIRTFPWPKSMRWGSGSLRWVRPLHSIVCTLDGEVVPFEVANEPGKPIKSGDVTYGHRFMGPDAIKVREFDDYVEKLARQKVMLDPEARAAHILEDAKNLAHAQNLELIEDDALLHEVAGLVEWPTALMGTIDDEFMEIPQEVLTSTMRANQKYLALQTRPFETRSPSHGTAPQGEGDKQQPHGSEGATNKGPHAEEGAPAPVSKQGVLAPRFIVVSNIEPEDGGAAVINGNERVLRARFADARFLWEQDKQHSLEDFAKKLDQIKFYEGLGDMSAKGERIAIRSHQLATELGVDPEVAFKAGELCKADLVSGMVYEFPELQGLIGAYYAEDQGEPKAVSNAIRDHYAPRGADDAVPSEAITIAVALADRLDTLIGFWMLGEKPTGSKDPFALRRAALGIVRIILENEIRVSLADELSESCLWVWNTQLFERSDKIQDVLQKLKADFGETNLVNAYAENLRSALEGDTSEEEWNSWKPVQSDLLSFFADRLKVYLRDKGVKHDLVDAVFALPGQDDLLLIVRRVDALAEFLVTDDGANLLAGTKRAANILRIEEKKDKTTYAGAPDASLFESDEEKALASEINVARDAAAKAVGQEDFAAAMAAIAKLRGPVDAFFEKVTVNSEDNKVRENRLKLLAEIRTALQGVADFSKIEG